MEQGRNLELQNLKINIEKVLNGFDRDDLLYIHVHMFFESFPEEIQDNFELPMSIEEFESIKKIFNNFKKIKVSKLRKDLKDIYVCENKSSNINSKIFQSVGDICDANKMEVTIYYLLKCKYEVNSEKMKTEKMPIEDMTGEIFSQLVSPVLNMTDTSTDECTSIIIIAILGFLSMDGELNNAFKTYISSILFRRLCISSINVNNALLKEKDVQIVESEKQISKYKKQVEDSKGKIQNLNNDLKKLKESNRVFEKFEGIDSLAGNIDKIDENIKKIFEVNSAITKEIKNAKSESIKAVYEAQIDKLTTQIGDLKGNIKIKNNECNELKKKLDMYENKEFFEEKIKEFICKHGISSSLDEFIQPMLRMNAIEVIDDEVKGIEQCLDDSVPCKVIRNLVYVTVKEDSHIVNYMDGRTAELNSLPDNVYLAENQFIFVDENNNFCRTTTSIYEDNGKPLGDLELCIIDGFNPLTVNVNGRFKKINTESGCVGKYRIQQVVAINDRDEIKRAFKNAKFSLDLYMKSIRARNLDVFFVLKKTQSGMFLRNVETGQEDFYIFDCGEFKIEEQSIIFVQDGTVKNSMYGSKFYTTSSLYKDRIDFGPIIVNDDDSIMVQKQNGEKVLVKDFPLNINAEDGMVIAIDEFNNYLYIMSTQKPYIEKVVLKKTAKQVVCGEGKKVELNKGLVIVVGNPGNQDSYKNIFNREGYGFKMIDGYDYGYRQILKQSENAIAVFVSTNFCSHEVSLGMKEAARKNLLPNTKIFVDCEVGASRWKNELLKLELENTSDGSNKVRVTC